MASLPQIAAFALVPPLNYRALAISVNNDSLYRTFV